MRHHTSSPQPQAVKRKDKHLDDESNSNLAGSEHYKTNRTNPHVVKQKNK